MRTAILSSCVLMLMAMVAAPADSQTNENQPTETEPIETQPEAPSLAVDFGREIGPILSDNCFHCHGPDANHREADLRLDIQSAAHETAIDAGSPETSELINRILSKDPGSVMPPPDSGKSLTGSEKEQLANWIQQGGNYQRHWSFEKPVAPTPPIVDDPSWARNPIDQFVLAHLQRKSQTPSAEADKATLIRRVTLDLTGLPPTVDEVDAFLADDSPNAFEDVVDRLLESDRYGERMAQLWLDAARYADTMGYQADWERTQWRWRSWVIDAYNTNMPFDQFTIEQLAGDLLPNATVEQKIATGFNRNHRINDEGGIIPEEYLMEYLVDRVETTAGTWLGMTFGCARCHDHKFDPLSQKDFYRFLASFNSVPENGKDGRKGYAVPYIRVAVRGRQDEYEALQNEAARLTSELSQIADGLTNERQTWVTQQQEKLDQAQDDWSVATIEKIVSSDERNFEILDDGSALNPAGKSKSSTYHATIAPAEANGSVATRVTGIRLEALVDDSLSGGLSNGNGNFVLTDFTVDLRRQPETQPDGKDRPIKIAKASADHSQNKYPVANAIDKDPKSGWAVDGNTRRENRTAVFTFAKPFQLNPGDRLTIHLAHESKFANHAIGRFRLSLTDASEPTILATGGLPAIVADAIRRPDEKRSQAHSRVIADHFASVSPATRPLRKKLDVAEKQLRDFEKDFTTNTMVMEEMPEPRPTHILNRGVYDQPGELVSPGVPTAMLGDLPTGAKANRLGLAQWLVSGDHPLTARVVVNRYWAMFFGRGLVETTEDFGLQGAYPSHPELLDWLATQYPRIGWDTKELLRMIVTSSTYRQSSDIDDEMRETDPKNRSLARMTRFRLPAEMIRDQALFASNLLVQRVGGPSVKPYQPDGLWSELSFQSKSRTTDFYVQGKGEDLYRRSIYTFWKRSVPPPTMATFDAPSRDMCVLNRPRTNTPLQALALMNDPTFVEACRGIAEHVLKQDLEPPAQIGLAFKTILARDPDADELRILTASLNARAKTFAENRSQAKALLEVGESERDGTLPEPELAALTTCVMTIMNLDEAIQHE